MAKRIELEGGIRRHVPSVTQAPVEKPSLFSAAQQAIEIASDLGFVKAGVASLEPFDDEGSRLENFLDQGFHGEMAYLESKHPDGSLMRLDPTSPFAEAKAALVVALPYPAPTHEKTTRTVGRIASYARGDDYHHVIRGLLLDLADRLADDQALELKSRVCVDSAPVLERDLARRAGLVFFGKNTLGIAPGAGSHFLLGELLLDLALPTTVSAPLDGCGSCRLCLDACPTDAFIGPYQLDARRCVSYLTIETSGEVPHDLRGAIGDRLFGCDDCQSVCPYNAKGATRTPHPALAARASLSQLDAIEILRLGSSRHRKLVAGTALRRASRPQLARNAAIVLGNSGKAEAIAPLKDAAEQHPAPVVRRHALWALHQLASVSGHAAAQAALEELRQLNDQDLQAELHALEESSSSHAAPDAHRD